MLNTKDFYKELKLRGYHYKDAFRPVQEARADGLHGKVAFNYNWVTFIDAMMQIKILGADTRMLMLPTKIRKLRIVGLHHFNLLMHMQENQPFDVYVDTINDRIVSGGVEIIGLRASMVQRRRSPGIPVLEKYTFLPHFPTPELSASDALRVCVQLALENTPVLKTKFVEVDTDGRAPIIPYAMEAVEDLPLITGEYMFLSSQKLEPIAGVHVENGKLITQTNCYCIIVGGLCGEQNEMAIKTAQKCLMDDAYLMVREKTSSNINSLKLPENFNMICVLPLKESQEVLLLLRKKPKNTSENCIVLEISSKDSEMQWIEKAQNAIANKTPVILYSHETLSGIVGMVNCLRKEPDGNMVSCFYVDDVNAPQFDIQNPFYANQLALGLGINVYKNGRWGSYRHLQLKLELVPERRTDHICANVMHRGDLSSFRWLKGGFELDKCSTKVTYAALNFKDVMLATGRLGTELFRTHRLQPPNSLIGFEYAGIDLKTGKRIMYMLDYDGGITSYNQQKPAWVFNVPDHWSLKEAATVPVVYITVYYAFFMISDIRKGKSILIHAGTGGIGIAAISIALAYNLEVFTTCSTPLKKKFLLDTFPQLKGKLFLFFLN